MKYEDVCTIVSKASFPLSKIKKVVSDIDDTVYKVVDASEPDGMRVVTDRVVKMNLARIHTSSCRHTVEEKIKHDCFKTTFNDKVQGFSVDYSYKFCPTCKTEVEKRAVVFSKGTDCMVIEFP